MDDTITIIETVILIISVLGIASIVLALTHKVKLPFTVMLVIVGAVLGQLHIYGPETLQKLFTEEVSPDLIFYVCLPTLLFESAFNLDAKKLRENIVPVMTLAIPGLLLSTFIIGFILSYFTGLDFLHGLLLGAILSATDPVAVVSIFRKLGTPGRLTILVEGESLFNDATSIVTAKLIMTVIIAGAFTTHELTHGIFDFFYEFIGGIVVGWLIAIIVGYFLGKVDNDREIEISLTTILAYATFIIAQDVLYVSGVMATVTAGIVIGNWGRHRISPYVANYMHMFWDYIAYFANAMIFLIVGVSVDLMNLIHNFYEIVIVIIAMIISRAILIYGLVPIICKLPKAPHIDYKYKTVMFWGGLRGAIALAIVLSLDKTPQSELYESIVLGAVLFTLLFQGLTMEKIVKMLKLNVRPISEQLAGLEYKTKALKTAMGNLGHLKSEHLISDDIYKKVYSECVSKTIELQKESHELKRSGISDVEEKKLIYLESLSVEKSAYYNLYAHGHLDDKTYKDLADMVDIRSDFIRTGDTIEHAIDLIAYKNTFLTKIIKKLENIAYIKYIMFMFQKGGVVRNYKLAWAQQWGSMAALKHIAEVTKIESESSYNSVKTYFLYWHETSKKRLEKINAQFPEFVNEMQTRLAKRTVLYSKIDEVRQFGKLGVLSDEAVRDIVTSIEVDIREIKERKGSFIFISDEEAIHKNKLLKSLDDAEYHVIRRLLKIKVLPINTKIHQSGDTAKNIYFIIRGNIKQTYFKNGVEQDFETLKAGDAFGLVTAIKKEVYPITTTTVTPCAVAMLSYADFNKVQKTCPKFANKILKASLKRIDKFNALRKDD